MLSCGIVRWSIVTVGALGGLALGCSSDERDSYENGIHEWAQSNEVGAVDETNRLPGASSTSASSGNGSSSSGSGSTATGSSFDFDRDEVYVMDYDYRGPRIVHWSNTDADAVGFDSESVPEVLHRQELIFWGSRQSLYMFVADEGSLADYPTAPLSNDTPLSSCERRGFVLSDPDTDNYYLRCFGTTVWFDKDGDVLELPGGYDLAHVGYDGKMLLISGEGLAVSSGPDDVVPALVPDGGLVLAIRAVAGGFWVLMESGARYTVTFDGDFSDDGAYPIQSRECRLDKAGTLICVDATSSGWVVSSAQLGDSQSVEHPNVLNDNPGLLVTGP